MQAVEPRTPVTPLQSVRDLWCGGCGYGVVVRREPPECPMCRNANWRERPRPAHYN
jgi:rubrerythrin